ncbi:hypothetical protein [Chryseobacterium sp. MYb328]|uniref:hypothetical protein n=1 Tax=Chryseobacterium sp. MYb328 TaxID=2745231 RepID=UPI0030AF6BD2
MSTLLFIISAVLFQLPFATYQDTIRRFKRMQKYNPDKAFNYELENGKLNENTLYLFLVFVSGFIIALFPLYKGINLHWLILIISNIICLYLVTPFIAIKLYPSELIYERKMLFTKTVLYIVFGVIFYIVGNSLK